ncbi:MAG: 2OG-Fe(II) oxygenase family protein [Xanthomonadaceae bacterium]|nr:2OG-Fe(II) oxygenase family protein [Xanthomonadaceae bacterium]
MRFQPESGGARIPMISNEVEFEPYRLRFAQYGRVQVPGFLQAAAAERLHLCLRDEVPWTLAERSDGVARTLPAAEYAALSETQRNAIYQRAYQGARDGFQFVYDSYMLVRALQEGRDPGLVLHLVLEFMNSAEVIEFARWFTGIPDIVAANAQATRYLPGQFLTHHDDEDRKENRGVAYVINLSKGWHPDWGGLLQFHDAKGGVAETLMPLWNSVSMFKIPQSHSVSLVAPWAAQPRLAITGWFLRAKERASV